MIFCGFWTILAPSWIQLGANFGQLGSILGVPRPTKISQDRYFSIFRPKLAPRSSSTWARSWLKRSRALKVVGRVFGLRCWCLWARPRSPRLSLRAWSVRPSKRAPKSSNTLVKWLAKHSRLQLAAGRACAVTPAGSRRLAAAGSAAGPHPLPTLRHTDANTHHTVSGSFPPPYPSLNSEGAPAALQRCLLLSQLMS